MFFPTNFSLIVCDASFSDDVPLPHETLQHFRWRHLITHRPSNCSWMHYTPAVLPSSPLNHIDAWKVRVSFLLGPGIFFRGKLVVKLPGGSLCRKLRTSEKFLLEVTLGCGHPPPRMPVVTLRLLPFLVTGIPGNLHLHTIGILGDYTTPKVYHGITV